MARFNAERAWPGRWPLSAVSLLLGGALALLAIAAYAAFIWYERLKIIEAEEARLELMARVLEDQATRGVESAFLVLDTLGAEMRPQSMGERANIRTDWLQRSIAGFPLIRSVALVTADGRTIAASEHGDLGLMVNLDRLGLSNVAPRGSIGIPTQGRTLRDAVGPGSSVAKGVQFLPIGKRVDDVNPDSPIIIGLLNADYLSRQLEQSVAGTSDAAAVANLAGQVIGASRSAGLQPGRSIANLAPFTMYLPQNEHEQYVGQGIRPARQVAAFRASHERGLVVLVEGDYATCLSRWRELAEWFGALVLGISAFILGMAILAARSLRSREATRRRLDEASAEIALRARELGALVTCLHELIFRTDTQGRLTFINTRVNEAFDTDPSELLGLPLVKLVDRSCRSELAALFNASTVGVRKGRFTVTQPDGQRRIFELAIVPFALDGDIDGFAGSAVDVTDRVRSAREMKQQLAYSDLLLEISPLPIALVDRLGAFLQVNHAWELFHGVAREQAVGNTAQVLFGRELMRGAAPVDPRMAQADVERARWETHWRAADGSMRDVVFTEVPVPTEDGDLRGTLSVMMDVSEFRDAERATREARDAAEEASRAKSEFIANISHELRTPLQSILGFSELGAARTKDHPRAVGMFSAIHSAGKRMLALVNDLLDVAKIESAVGTFHLERADVRDSIRNVLREVDPLLASKGLVLHESFDDAPLLAKIDPMRFQQVVRNVLANAIKFSPQNGQIEVSGDVEDDHRTIRVSIRDHGPGIPPAEINKIFDAFVQSSATRDGSGGTGLGLAISRSIMTVFGGRIAAENMPDGGSMFHLWLPWRGTSDTVPMGLTGQAW